MNTPEVWFAIPSANPEKCRKVLPIWRKMGYKTAVLQNRERADIPADIVRWSDSYPGWPQSINILARDVVPKDAPIIVSGGDDMLPDPNLTAQQIATQFIDHFRGTFGVMQPHGDRFFNTHLICGSPWLGREWINRAYGGAGPMPGMYHHNWADVELYLVSKGYGRLWSRTELTQSHEHFLRTGETPPAYWRNAMGTDLADCQLFAQRTFLGFADARPLEFVGEFDRSVITDDVIAGARERLTRNAQQAAELARVLAACKATGRVRVAVAGHQTLALALAGTLSKSPVEIVGWIDPLTTRTQTLGYRILATDALAAAKLDAVILLSDGESPEYWHALAPLAARGIPIPLIGRASPDEQWDRLSHAVAHLRSILPNPADGFALYGAGQHTRLHEPKLASLGVRAIIDDNPPAHNASLAGIPIVSPAAAAEMKLAAAVISSDRHENAMWKNAQPLRDRGMRVVALYNLFPA